MNSSLFACALAIGALAAPGAADAQLQVNLLAQYSTGLGSGGAEISDFDPVPKRMFVVNGVNNTLDIVDLANPASPSLISRISLAAYGGQGNSVAVANGVVGVAVQAAVAQDPGVAVFLDVNGAFLGQATVGALPDMITFTHGGTKALVANEGEPNNAYTVDPEGTVSIVDLSGGPGSPVVTTVSFVDFNVGNPRNAELSPLVRVFGPGATVAQDLEPEYITVSPDDATAWVTLQEANAIAVIDIATASILRIDPLGFKDHSIPGNGLDASDQPAGINILNWPVSGMYQPDAIASYVVGGTTYVVSANEGDARAYAGLNEEVRVSSGGYQLDAAVFPNAATLKQNANLGRLTVTNQGGNLDADAQFERIQVYGARSFSIWNGTTGALVFDSGDDFEQITATEVPAVFNSNGDAGTFDTRSDNKGPEPEGVSIGTLKGRTYAFVALERTGGFMVYDVTDPLAPTFVLYEPNASLASAPEGIVFVPASDGPDGRALVTVSNEVSGTVSIYAVESTLFALTVLHNNDGESKLISAPGQPNYGEVARFKTLVNQLKSEAAATTDGAIMVSSGDNFLAGPEFNASLVNPEPAPIYDAVAMDAVGYDAVCLGNHDFDFNPDVLARFIGDFPSTNPPFLSANIDVSAEPGLLALEMAGRIRPSTIVTVGGEQVGIIGAVTPLLPAISSPRDVVVDPNVAAAVQAEIDALTLAGVNKIVLISHLQSILEDQALIAQLRGLDVAVAGGGDDILANPGDLLVPGDVSVGSYPRLFTDLDGRQIPTITTGGDYKYVGRLVVCFDAAGNVAFVDPISGPVRVSGVAPDAVAADPACQAAVVTPVENYIAAQAANVIATTCPPLDGRRTQVRTMETNLGNLSADALLWQATQLAASFGAPTPEVALQNSGGIRNNAIIPTGPFTELNTFQVLPFANFTSIVEAIPAAQFKEIMENAVSRVAAVDGRFAQIAGFRFVWNPAGTAQIVDNAGTVLTPGNRVIDIQLDNGTWIVRNGVLQAGAPNVDIATIDFLARGGDQYPFRGAPFTTLGVTYQQALYNYVVTGLGGTIGCAGYPDGGSGRITQGAPVAVTLSRFTAVSAPEGVDIEWATTAERNHAYFDILRQDSPATAWVRVNAAPVTGEGSYRYRDLNAPDGSLVSYRLEAVDRNGVRELAGELQVQVNRLPGRFQLAQNWPNPFLSGTTFALDIPAAGRVTLDVFDASGRRIRSLVDGPMAAGGTTLDWDGRSADGIEISAGVYFLRAFAGGEVRTIRLLKTK